MIYLILPKGNTFGWGVCGKYLVREIADYSEIKYITEEFNAEEVGDELNYYFLRSKLISPDEATKIARGELTNVSSPIIQAISDHSFTPWLINLKGSYKVGYTFFEMNILPKKYFENGRNNFDIIVTGSTWCEEILKDNGLKNVSTIIQGIDPQIFNPSHSEKSILKDKFVVFSGGRFVLRKGQDIVIKAYKVLQDRHSDVLLVNAWHNIWPETIKTMIKSPHINEQSISANLSESLHKIFQTNKIDTNRVISIPGRSNAQMASVYKNSDIGLFPNRCEGGTNLMLMEYMACGKPVIASYTSGHKDILTNKNSIMINKMEKIETNLNENVGAIWDEPDLEETIEHLEWAYQHQSDLKSFASQAGSDLAGLTWQKAGKAFYELVTKQDSMVNSDF